MQTPIPGCANVCILWSNDVTDRNANDEPDKALLESLRKAGLEPREGVPGLFLLRDASDDPVEARAAPSLAGRAAAATRLWAHASRRSDREWTGAADLTGNGRVSPI